LLAANHQAPPAARAVIEAAMDARRLGAFTGPAVRAARKQLPRPDLIRVLGAGNEGTLATRANIAKWAGEGGDAARGWACCRSCCPAPSGC
jgi:hypothetical protein